METVLAFVALLVWTGVDGWPPVPAAALCIAMATVALRILMGAFDGGLR